MTEKEEGIPEPTTTKTVELAEGLRKGGDIVDSSLPIGTPAIPHLDAAPADAAPADAAPAVSDEADTGAEQ